jgi:hypothetical protein
MPIIGLIFFCASAIPVVSPAKSYAEAVLPTKDPETADTLNLQGARLRAEIDATFKQLRVSNSIKSSVNGGNDVTPIVLRYISVGSSFDDAAAILRAAGCKVGRGQQGQVFEWTNLGGGYFNFFGYAFGVSLAPRVPGDFSEVKEVRATIFSKYVPNSNTR